MHLEMDEGAVLFLSAFIEAVRTPEFQESYSAWLAAKTQNSTRKEKAE